MKLLTDSLSRQGKEIQSLSELRVIFTIAGQSTMWCHHYLSESVTNVETVILKLVIAKFRNPEQRS